MRDAGEGKSSKETAEPTNGHQASEKTPSSRQAINIANIIKWDPTKVEELNYLKEHKQDLVNPQNFKNDLHIIIEIE